MNGILYKLTFPSGKSYIGITTKSLEQRVARHVKNSDDGKSLALSRAIRKYGDFQSEMLAIGDIDYLKSMEVKAIAAFNTFAPNGYNMTAGGDGMFGFVMDAHSRAKIADKARGNKRNTGRKLTAEIKAKLTGRKRSNETKARIACARALIGAEKNNRPFSLVRGFK